MAFFQGSFRSRACVFVKIAVARLDHANKPTDDDAASEKNPVAAL
jgi:hypothetical protein